MLAPFDTRQLGVCTKHEVTYAQSVSGDSRCRIDGYRSACLGSGSIWRQTVTITNRRSYEGAFARKGTRDAQAAVYTGQATAEVSGNTSNRFSRLDQYVSLEYQRENM